MVRLSGDTLIRKFVEFEKVRGYSRAKVSITEGIDCIEKGNNKLFNIYTLYSYAKPIAVRFDYSLDDNCRYSPKNGRLIFVTTINYTVTTSRHTRTVLGYCYSNDIDTMMVPLRLSINDLTTLRTIIIDYEMEIAKQLYKFILYPITPDLKVFEFFHIFVDFISIGERFAHYAETREIIPMSRLELNNYLRQQDVTRFYNTCIPVLDIFHEIGPLFKPRRKKYNEDADIIYEFFIKLSRAMNSGEQNV